MTKRPIQTSKKTLLKIIDMIYDSMDKHYAPFFSLWKNFVYDYADDNILFRDNENFSLKDEVFTYNDIIFNNIEIAIRFDIERIIRLIGMNSIKPVIKNSEHLKNNYKFSKTDLPFTSRNRPTLPILIYFPLLHNNCPCEYLVIDGNHRITAFHENKENFNFMYIPPKQLSMGCFSDLNSWILYTFMLFYHNIPKSANDFESFMHNNFYTVNLAKSILSDVPGDQ